MPNHDRFECQTVIDSDAILHLHRHTRFRRQELAQDEINPDVLAMSGHIARRCSEQKRVRIPAMKVSEWGHLLRALEIERVCH